MGSIPGRGTKIPHAATKEARAPQLEKLPHTAQLEKVPHSTTRESPRTHLEKLPHTTRESPPTRPRTAAQPQKKKKKVSMFLLFTVAKKWNNLSVHP